MTVTISVTFDHDALTERQYDDVRIAIASAVAAIGMKTGGKVRVTTGVPADPADTAANLAAEGT